MLIYHCAMCVCERVRVRVKEQERDKVCVLALIFSYLLISCMLHGKMSARCEGSSVQIVQKSSQATLCVD